MDQSKKIKLRRYKKISLEDRKSLIDSVIKKKKKIVDAAAEVGLHPSTARMILVKFKEEGTIFEKKEDRMQR